MANPPKVVISKSTVKNAGTEVTAEGEVTFPGGLLELSIHLSNVGLAHLILPSPRTPSRRRRRTSDARRGARARDSL